MNKIYLAAIEDIRRSLESSRLTFHIALNELQGRYRRTMLGPFWATLSIAILILSLGLIYSKLWKTNLSEYLPFLTSGYVVWLFILATLTEGSNLFITQEHILKQVKFPYFQLSFICVLRNLLIMAHHFVIFLLVALFFDVNISWATFLFIPGLIILIFSLIWVVILIGMISARYRDIPMLITNILSISMFITPILYKPEALGENAQWIAHYNILFHYVEIVRKPMLGDYPLLLSWQLTSATALLGAFLVFCFFAKKRTSIIFWL